METNFFYKCKTTTEQIGTLAISVKKLTALEAHEIHLASRQIIKSNAGKALKADEPKCIPQEESAQRRSKGKALKIESESSSDGTSEESTDDEVALMSRKFKQMLKKKGRSNRLFRRDRRSFRCNNKEDSKEIICYECKKPGNVTPDFSKK